MRCGCVGPTGTTICPGGGTGFAISQRAVAYDPVTDTWYAGGWNAPTTIYHFSSAGTISLTAFLWA